MNKLSYILFFTFYVLTSPAQEMANTEPLIKDSITKITQVNSLADEPKMADLFRSEGKIYVVIAVLSIIFVCLMAYLIYIDIKLKKLEKKINQSNKTL